ncbi:hypothetical protein C8Q74DRAFT_1374042 [Fomes fomentarius]|nr:hypothetical protein C8Q74DRAFT_1374042 [Fomes fomentarius]
MGLQRLMGSSKAQPSKDTMLDLALNMQFTPDGRAVNFWGRFGHSPEISSTSAKASSPPAPAAAAVEEKKPKTTKEEAKGKKKEEAKGKKKEETTEPSPYNVVVHVHPAPPASHSRRASAAHSKHQAIDITAAATAGQQNVIVVRNSRSRASTHSSGRANGVLTIPVDLDADGAILTLPEPVAFSSSGSLLLDATLNFGLPSHSAVTHAANGMEDDGYCPRLPILCPNGR